MDQIDHLQVKPIERSSLREQVAQTLRDQIISGRLKPGTKITERDVADLLKISRMPARDALIDLERQGLVISRPGARYIIELTEKDIRNLYQIRLALEKLALAAAIEHIGEPQLAQLRQKLALMQQAVRAQQPDLYTSSDIEFHELIWEASQNHYLTDILRSMIGPVFMLISIQTRFQENWGETLDLHTQLAQHLADRNLESAQASLAAHMQVSLTLALKAVQSV